jgi:hypothetical protein
MTRDQDTDPSIRGDSDAVAADPDAPPASCASCGATFGSPDATDDDITWVCLDWYDGPLTEIAAVSAPAADLGDGCARDASKYVEVRTIGGWIGMHPEDLRCGANGLGYHMNHMRFSREELQAMLDLYDGKPVTGFFGETSAASKDGA